MLFFPFSSSVWIFFTIFNEQFAQTYSKKGIVHLREIFTPGMLKVPKSPAALKELESVHKV